MTFNFSAERFNVFFDKTLGPEARKKAFTGHAIRLRDEALDRNARILGRRPSYETFVDGRAGAALDTVRPGGTIVFRFGLGFGIAQYAVGVLRTVSPYDPTPDGLPHYRDRHFVIVDDVIVEPPYDGITDFDRLLIVNDRIYARFLEARYGVYRDLAYPSIHRQFRQGYTVSYVFDDYFGERQPAILIRPKG